ncbi:DUF3558 domain-containing protein [Amycolatopsis acidicola]|uniref:DUF3558 domain-containing protein n=1 Tax=Amycolatopsis acidicola TaxID=2596893 RepID=A0A5N0VNI1_9PSEU|nr:DUF3558 family protein [Amycolatopsis acidicola]KAA9166864.1 DUF3558 domain-containing protein [Amycolatopsis acidicola]
MSICKRNGVVLISAIAIIVLGSSGCSNENSGDPSPATQSSTAIENSSAGSNQDSQLSALKACDLLTQAELAVMKVRGSGQQQDTAASGASSGCQWAGDATNGAVSRLSADVRPGQGIDSVNPNGGQATTGTVDARPAVQVVDNPSGRCTTALAVSATSRVDFTYMIIGTGNTIEACETLNQIVTIASRKLPKYEG